MKILRLPSLILLLLFVALTPLRSVAAGPVAQAAPQAKGDLTTQAYLLWQSINEARSNPRQAMARLGISEQTAMATLGSDAWLLDQGLPPLAWNGQLQTAALDHGRDMLTKLYYSHVTPDGLTPMDRIAATGYEAAGADETLAALVFDKFLDTDTALTALFDNMLRDELTGVAGVGRNIFSTSLTEIGIAFMAESVALLAGQPYVYLIVADFGAPLEERFFVVGQIEAGSRLVMRNLSTGLWSEATILPADTFQFQLLGGEEVLFHWNSLTLDFSVPSTHGFDWGRNYAIDLRQQPAGP